MKKSAFTLTELIFVILLIAIAAAVALPKFTHLKKAADVRNSIKNALDAARMARDVAANMTLLESDNSFKLKDLVKLKGKGWSYSERGDGTYIYSKSRGQVVRINLNKTNRYISLYINCWEFRDSNNDAYLRNECAKMVGLPTPLGYSNRIYRERFNY
jgi:prepilin-type N-terminal cleavage/methylation domain-containing protein